MAGEIKASPRFGLMGLFADALKGAQSGMNYVDLPYVGGLGDLMLGGAPQLADDISYQGLSALVRGGNAATGGIGTYGLKPETVDLAGVMTGLGGLAKPAVNAAGRAALPAAREFVETVGARNMSGMPMAKGQIGSIGLNIENLDHLEQFEQVNLLAKELMSQGIERRAARSQAQNIVDKYGQLQLEKMRSLAKDLINKGVESRLAHIEANDIVYLKKPPTPIENLIKKENKRKQNNVVNLTPEEKAKKLKNTHVLWHTSSEKNIKVNKDGTFGDVFFFANEPYYMGDPGKRQVYALEIDENDVIDTFDLEDREAIRQLKYLYDIDDDDAYDVLTDRKQIQDIIDDPTGEAGWRVQQIQGEAAKREGYEAARGRDEQGTVYMMPMFGKESRLQNTGDMHWRDFYGQILDKYR